MEVRSIKSTGKSTSDKGIKAEWGMEKKEQRLLYANADDWQKDKNKNLQLWWESWTFQSFWNIFALKDNVAEQEVLYQLKVRDKLLEKNDTVKFVSGSQEDLLKALELIRTYDLTNRCHVYLSPVFWSNRTDANSRIYVETSVEWCTVADTDA